jgi:uncharacterized membrane protein
MADESPKIEEILGIVLLAGIVAALSFVLLGSAWYLLQHGTEPLQYDLLPVGTYDLKPSRILSNFLTLQPLGLIEMGLLLLVLTQFLRVACLTIFYYVTRDTPFIIICSFILLVLIYSLFLRNYMF